MITVVVLFPLTSFLRAAVCAYLSGFILVGILRICR